MKELEIYFSDLTEDAQKKVLKFMGLEKPSDGNYEYNPIFVLPKPEED